MEKKLMLIVNPAAGRGGYKVNFTEALHTLDLGGYRTTLFFTSGRGDATEFAARHAANFDTVACIGGDGTICEVAGELCHTGATFYVVPGGTGNDFARAFHLPKNPMAAFEAQLAGEPVEIDCGRMNGQSFLNVSGSGFDVAVLQKTEELKAVYPGEKGRALRAGAV